MGEMCIPKQAVYWVLARSLTSIQTDSVICPSHYAYFVDFSVFWRTCDSFGTIQVWGIVQEEGSRVALCSLTSSLTCVPCKSSSLSFGTAVRSPELLQLV